MKREDVKNLLISEILRVTGVDFIDADESILLIYSEIDSLDSVDILMGCEHELGIDLNFDDFDQVKTFGDAIDTLFAIVENLDCPKPKPQKSLINWQTGEARLDGLYIVTYFDFVQKVDICRILEKVGYRWMNGSVEIRECNIKAWCKLSDIIPYKEE